MLSRSKSCPISSVYLAKREFRSRVAMALECSRFLVFKARDVLSDVNSAAVDTIDSVYD